MFTSPFLNLLDPVCTDAVDAADEPRLLLLEAVAANDIPRARAVLARHAREHARDYQHCATLAEATRSPPLNPEDASVAPASTVSRAVRDLINNSRDDDGYSAMILALDHPGQFGALPMIRFLLDHGADLNAVPARVRRRIEAEAAARRVAKNFTPERFPQTLLVEKVLGN
jgi:hypothetical protein